MVGSGFGVQFGPGSCSMDPAAAGLDAVVLVVPTFLFLRIQAFNICTGVQLCTHLEKQDESQLLEQIAFTENKTKWVLT